MRLTVWMEFPKGHWTLAENLKKKKKERKKAVLDLSDSVSEYHSPVNSGPTLRWKNVHLGLFEDGDRFRLF